MIWGKTLDPGKLYTETVHADIHLSMAALESRGDRGAEYNGYTQVMLKTDEDEFLLCTLVHGLIFQQTLDVKVKQGEQISIYARGKNKVHLTGYSVIVEGAVVNPEPNESINNASLQPVPVSIHTGDSHPVVNHQEEVNNTPVTIKVEYPMEEPVNHWQPTLVHRLPRILEPSQSFVTHQRAPKRLIPIRPKPSVKVTMNHANKSETEAAGASILNHGLPYQLPSSTRYENNTNGDEDTAVTGGRENLNPSSEQEGVSGASEGDQALPSEGHPPTMCKLPYLTFTQRKLIVAEGASQDGSEELTDTKEDVKINVLQNVSSQSQLPVAAGLGQLQAQLFQRVQFQDCKEGLSTLMPTAIRGYQCEFCLKFFKHISNFKSHQLIHTNLKPYKCRFCGVGFKQTGNLKAHERIHTGDRPYKCSYCSKQFARSTTRNTHERLHTGSVTYQCGVCSKVFMQRNSLKKHELMHET